MKQDFINYNEFLLKNDLREKPPSFSNTEFKRLLSLIITTFGEDYLSEKSEYNLLSKLWLRADRFASYELITLAKAIEKACLINKDWLDQIIKEIKKNDTNNYRGFINELLFVGYIREDGYKIVIPRSINAGDFDLDLEDCHSNKINISLKSFGKSVHKENFDKLAKNLECNFEHFLKNNNINNKSAYIKIYNYPTEAIFNNINFCLLNKDLITNNSLCNDDENFSITINSMFDDTQHIYLGETNYSLLIESAFHNNEVKNLCDHIQNEISKLAKNDNKIILIIHLDQFCSTIALQDHINTLYEDFYSTRQIRNIDIILFKYFIVFSEKKGCYELLCYIKQSPNPKILPFAVNYEIQFCNFTSNLDVYKLFKGDSSDSIIDKYIYQNGKQYIIKEMGCTDSAPKNDFGIEVYTVLKTDGYGYLPGLYIGKIPTSLIIL